VLRQKAHYTLEERLTGMCANCNHPQRLHGKGNEDGVFRLCAVRRGFLKECPCHYFVDAELQPLGEGKGPR